MNLRPAAISDRLFSAGIVLFAVLLPLEIIPNKYISILSLLITILLLPRPFAQLATRKLSPRRELRNWMWILLTLPLLAVAAAAYANPQNLHTDALRTFTVLVFRTWLIARFATLADLNLFKRATIAVGAAVTAFGFYQFFGDLAGLKHSLTFLRETYSSSGTHPFPRVHSLAREPLLLANYLFIPMALLVIEVINNRKNRLALGLLLGLMFVLLLTLDARSAYYAMIPAGLALLFTLRERRDLLRKGLIAVLGIGAAALLLLIISIGPGPLAKFINHGAEFGDASFQNRVKTWQEFPGIFTDSPLFGVGLGNGSLAILHLPCPPLPSDPPVFNNTYLTVAAESGLLGLAALLPLIAMLVREAWPRLKRRITRQDTAYVLILIAYAVQITSYEAFLNLRFWGVIALSLAAFRVYDQSLAKQGGAA